MGIVSTRALSPGPLLGLRWPRPSQRPTAAADSWISQSTGLLVSLPAGYPWFALFRHCTSGAQHGTEAVGNLEDDLPSSTTTRAPYAGRISRQHLAGCPGWALRLFSSLVGNVPDRGQNWSAKLPANNLSVSHAGPGLHRRHIRVARMSGIARTHGYQRWRRISIICRGARPQIRSVAALTILPTDLPRAAPRICRERRPLLHHCCIITGTT